MQMLLVLILAWFLGTSCCYAADVPLPDDAMESRAHALFGQMRCTVCEGQSLAASHARLAVEMRNLIRSQISDGRSDTEILSYFTDRYGQDVLMHPPVAATTALLWGAPIIFAGIGVLIVWRIRRQSVSRRTC